MDIYFYLILGIAAAFGTAFAIITRGIFYASTGTDNEMMAYAAAQSSKWRMPSDIHKYGAGKTRMKDVAIMLLSVMQRIFRDNKTDFPYTVLTGFAVSISAILIFFIGENLFSPTVGLTLGLFYIISFWPWQVALYGGHANIANVFFLLAVLAGLTSQGNDLLLLVSAGALLCCALFSSASASKLIVPLWTAIFFSQYRTFLVAGDYKFLVNILALQSMATLTAIFTVLWGLGFILALSVYKRVVELMYKRQAPNFLNSVLSDRTRFSLEHYQAHALRKIKQTAKWTFWVGISALILFSLIPANTVLKVLAGFSLCLLLFTFPNVKKNISGWFNYFLLPQRKTHFSAFRGFFAKRGITVQQNTRGAGLSWIPKLLWTFVPFHTTLFIAVFIVGQYKSISIGNMYESVLLVVIAAIALSPIIWAEITKAPQIPRSYSSALITGLLLPAYTISNIGWTAYTLPLFFGIGILAFAWNFWRFADDVYPARMAVRNFMRIVRQLGINDIYTYQTSHNSFFIDAIPGIGKSEYLPKRDIVPPFRIHYIQRLDEVTDGWIAIPGTNPMEITPNGEIANDDYTKDPIRNRLIETKKIEKVAAAKLKTYFTSSIWVNEDDVASYYALHLRGIGPDDRYRGYAWLVHSSKLKDIKI